MKTFPFRTNEQRLIDAAERTANSLDSIKAGLIALTIWVGLIAGLLLGHSMPRSWSDWLVKWFT